LAKKQRELCIRHRRFALLGSSGLRWHDVRFISALRAASPLHALSPLGVGAGLGRRRRIGGAGHYSGTFRSPLTGHIIIHFLRPGGLFSILHKLLGTASGAVGREKSFDQNFQCVPACHGAKKGCDIPRGLACAISVRSPWSLVGGQGASSRIAGGGDGKEHSCHINPPTTVFWLKG